MLELELERSEAWLPKSSASSSLDGQRRGRRELRAHGLVVLPTGMGSSARSAGLEPVWSLARGR